MASEGLQHIGLRIHYMGEYVGAADTGYRLDIDNVLNYVRTDLMDLGFPLPKLANMNEASSYPGAIEMFWFGCSERFTSILRNKVIDACPDLLAQKSVYHLPLAYKAIPLLLHPYTSTYPIGSRPFTLGRPMQVVQPVMPRRLVYRQPAQPAQFVLPVQYPHPQARQPPLMGQAGLNAQAVVLQRQASATTNNAARSEGGQSGSGRQAPPSAHSAQSSPQTIVQQNFPIAPASKAPSQLIASAASSIRVAVTHQPSNVSTSASSPVAPD
ncbi:hypothetical protein BV25DRAFT_1843610 [Artomyces pyxidatus]|uniref:Uncharacterized protein n=1 Tax=Artomyces pyxidatus TaxID=48021 RepID=A0ACB8SF22_9AGAM|nr:hypothetical protein BV25DRAFT_1843610 [Artomyces pyxidatus]